MKVKACLLWQAAFVTTCLAAPAVQECTILNKIVSQAKIQAQATAFCEVFIPRKTVTQASVATITATVPNPTPTSVTTLVVEITPPATTITTVRDLCAPTARGRSIDLERRAVSPPVANIQILGTSRDKRPPVWRLLAADALIKACSCLGVPSSPQTTTMISTSTVYATLPQVTTTVTVTSTAPQPTIYVSETTQFRLVTSNSNIVYLSGLAYWYYQAYDSNNPVAPSGFYRYKIQNGYLRSDSSDGLTVVISWGGNPAYWAACDLDENLMLTCPGLTFYERVSAAGKIIDDYGNAVTIRAIPECS
jgi:hypothetical protein